MKTPLHYTIPRRPRRIIPARPVQLVDKLPIVGNKMTLEDLKTTMRTAGIPSTATCTTVKDRNTGTSYLRFQYPSV